MSFMSFGPLGSFGWCTTMLQALTEQAEYIKQRFSMLSEAINQRNIQLNNQSNKQSSTQSSPVKQASARTKQAFPSLIGQLIDSNETIKLKQIAIINSDGSINQSINQSIDQLDPFLAAILTCHEFEDWPIEKRTAFRSLKRDYSDQPNQLINQVDRFRADNLASLQRRHQLIESVDDLQYEVIRQLSVWLCAMVVHLRLREMMAYPLIRDQIDPTIKHSNQSSTHQSITGPEFHTRALHRNDELRSLLRTIRHAVNIDPSSHLWFLSVETAQWMWLTGWEKETRPVDQLSNQAGNQASNGSWLEILGEYLANFEVDMLRDACAANTAYDDPLSSEQSSSQSTKSSTRTLPYPPTNHDLNYGQQLKQMFEICFVHMLRSGNMQGISRVRFEPDWPTIDGFEPTDRLQYTTPISETGYFPEPTNLGIQKPEQDPDPETSAQLPPSLLLHGNQSDKEPVEQVYFPFGTAVTRIAPLPDAQSKDQRDQIDALMARQAAECSDAHKRAYVKQFGSVEADVLAKKTHVIENAQQKLTSVNEFMADSPHTTDPEGSYRYDEVSLAFRNHGTHWESLNLPITQLGEHFLLIHYDVQYWARLESYRLKIHGCVKYPVTLTLHQVKEMGKGFVWTQPLVMECSGNGRSMMTPRYNRHVPWGLQAFGCYCWTGMPLRLLLQRVGVSADTVDVVFTGYDAGIEKGELRYFQHSLAIHDPVIDYSMVVWAHNGVDLIPNHGYPLRLMVPGWYGNANIKWLQSIELINRKFKGLYQRTYSYTRTPTDNDVVCPAQELRPRAMIKPLGFPDFTTRKRTVLAGINQIIGRAWVGGGYYRAITRVEVSLDGGKSWLVCKMEPRLGMFAWLKFQLEVDLQVGLYDILVRAVDNLGEQQKIELDDWNWASMQDDAIHRMEVICVDKLIFTE